MLFLFWNKTDVYTTSTDPGTAPAGAGTYVVFGFHYLQSSAAVLQTPAECLVP
jgi:hypothetical protein